MAILSEFMSKVMPKVKAVGVLGFTGVRAATNAGSVLFGLKNLFGYLLNTEGQTQEEEHPALLPITYAAIGFSVITTLATVGPVFHRKFLSNTTSHPDTNYDEEDAQEQTEQKTNLDKKGKSIYLAFKSLSLLSMGFTSLNAYFTATVLSEFVFSDEETKKELEVGIQTFAIVCALSNALYTYSYRFQKIGSNAIRLADNLKDGHPHMDAVLAKTIGVSALTLISTPFYGYFSTVSTMNKLGLPAELATATAILSSTTALFSVLTSDVVSLYDFFNSAKQHPHYPRQSCVAPAVRWGIYTVGGLDSISSYGASTFISVIKTMQAISQTDADNHGIIAFAIFCALSKLALGFSFSVRETYLDTQDYYYQIKQRDGYEPIFDHTDINNESMPLIKMKKSIASLPKKQAAEQHIETDTLSKIDILIDQMRSLNAVTPSTTPQKTDYYQHATAPFLFQNPSQLKKSSSPQEQRSRTLPDPNGKDASLMFIL